MKVRKNSGFTLVEVLAAVAILVILLGVALVSTINYIDVLKLTELDNAAREIYMAAENRAVLLLGAQETKPVFKDAQTVPLSVPEPEISLLADTPDKTVYLTKDAIKDAIKSSALLANGNIEPVLWDGEGDFIITYDPVSGSVIEVFYVEKPLPDDVEISELLRFNVPNRGTRPKEIGGQKVLVGYYNGVADGGAQGQDTPPAPPADTPVITVTIENGIQLKATVEVDFRFDRVPDPKEKSLLQAAAKKAIVDGRLTVELRQADGMGGVYSLVVDDEYITEFERSSDIKFTYTWTLDSLVGLTGDTIKTMGITPGENFVVSATLTSPDGSFGTAFDAVEDNSLFATGSGGGAAYISNLRHLQNLNYATGKTFSAKQLNTVYCDTDLDGDGTIDENDDYVFIPIKNPNLAAYDGQGNEIRDLKLEPSENDVVGLFETVAGAKLENIRLCNTTVSAPGAKTVGVLVGTVAKDIGADPRQTAITDCWVYWSAADITGTAYRISGLDTDSSVGGLVGIVDDTGGDTEITGCRVYWHGEVTPVGSIGNYQLSGAMVGGLVGRAEGSVKIDSSFASTLLEGTSGNGAVGGLVGGAMGGNKITITRSYADCYLTGGGDVAGLVGRLADTSGTPAEAELTNSYAAGFIMDAGKDGGVERAAGLCMGVGKTTTEYVYSAMVRLDGENSTAPAHRLTQNEAESAGDADANGVFNTCTYFAGTGTVYGGNGTSAEGKDLSAVFTEMADGGVFATDKKVASTDTSITDPAKKTYPYNLLWKEADGPEAKLTAYDYPGLEALPHYGDWGKVDVDAVIPVGLAYYELYSDGYGVFGFDGEGKAIDHYMKTDDDPRTISGFGYAVIFPAEDVTGYNAVTIKINDNSVTSNSEDWKKIKLSDGTEYFIVPDAAIPTVSGPVEDFYTYLKLGMKPGTVIEEEREKLEVGSEYYFNPHFAKTVVALPKELPEDLPEGTGWGNTKAILSYKEKVTPKEVETEEGGKELKAESEISVRTTQQLENLRSEPLYFGYKFHQELNLDLGLKDGSGNSIYGQSPIGTDIYNFTGIYDAGIYDNNNKCTGSHTIVGLNISGGGKRGLFGYSSGLIQNLTVKDAVVQGNDDVAAIAGESSGTIKNVAVIGGSFTGDTSVAGVVGTNSGGTVEYCYNTGTVTGSGQYIGGVVGSNKSDENGNCTVENCYNTGAVTSNKDFVGGVVGSSGSNDTVKNCYNTGTVTGTDHIGGIVGGGVVTNCYNVGEVVNINGGTAYGVGGTATNCYFLVYTPGAANEGDGATSLTRGEFVQIPSGWDTTVWSMDASDTPYIEGYRPVLSAIPERYEGTETAPYIINNRLDLENIGASLTDRKDKTGEDYYYKLTEDIHLRGGSATVQWTPIGDSADTAFKAVFNGNNKTLTGLYTTHEGSASYQGLFGYSTGDIYDLTVESGDVWGLDYVGGIAGYNTGTLTNCVYNGSVTGGSYVGGIAGSSSGTVSYCNNSAAVTSSYASGDNTPAHVGGIVGNNEGGTVTNCDNGYDASGNAVSGAAVTSSGHSVGGIAGSSSGTVSNCNNSAAVRSSYASGSVGEDADPAHVGGIVGANSNTVSNCNNAGNVEAVDGDSVGGIVGSNSSVNGAVTDCLNGCDASGELVLDCHVTGRGYVGGIAGTNNHEKGQVTGCVNYAAVGTGENSNNHTVYIGGIAGNNGGMVSGCDNKGSVVISKGQSVGGIVGSNGAKGEVNKCDNYAAVTGSSYTGGIVGNNSGTVTYCVNDAEGVVTGTADNGSRTGGVVGSNTGGTVEKDYKNVEVGKVEYCANRAEVTSRGRQVGGVVGTNESKDAKKAQVRYCYNTGGVTGTEIVGGVVGYHDGVVEDCYNTGLITLKGNTGNAGGVVGSFGDGDVAVTLRNCYNVGDVARTGSVGGVVGTGRGTSSTVTNCYFLTGTAKSGFSDKDVINVAEPKTSDKFGDDATFIGWENSVWTWRYDTRNLWRPILIENPEKDVPKLGTVQVNGPGALEAIAKMIDESKGGTKGVEIELTGDIELDGNESWLPMGKNSQFRFDGTLDGGGHTITVKNGANYVGLFKAVGPDGTIKNLNVVGNVSANANSAATVGGIAQTNNGLVEDCTFTGRVTGSTNSNSITGGIVGENFGTVKDCTFTGVVTGGSNDVGGIVGKKSGSGEEVDCKYIVDNNIDISALLQSTGGARVVTASVGGGIPGSGTWTVSVNSADGSAGASFARDGELSAVDDGGGGTVPLYLAARDGDGAPVVLSVTYAYTAGDAAEEPGEVPAEKAAEIPGQAWALAALPPEPGIALPEARDPDDAEPEE